MNEAIVILNEDGSMEQRYVDEGASECKLGKKQGRAYIENITPIQRAVIKKTVAAAVLPIDHGLDRLRILRRTQPRLTPRRTNMNPSTTTVNSAVMMTRAEAELFMKAIDDSMKSTVAVLARIQRRKWRDSEKAMAGASYNQRLDHLRRLQERIGTVFNLYGY